MEFYVDDMVVQKISPIKGMVRFGFKGKLSHRYVGPYPSNEIVGPMAYKVQLPPNLSGV